MALFLACNPFLHSYKRSIVIMFLLASMANCGHTQASFFDENFSGYPNGTTAGPNWYIVATDCDDPTPNEGLGISAFGVYNGQFTVNDVEGGSCCPAGEGGGENYVFIGPFNANGYCRLQASIYWSYTLNQECNSPTTPVFGCQGSNYNDNVHFEYSIDGGPWHPIGNVCLNANGGPNGGAGVGTPIFLSPSSMISFRVIMSNNEDDEFIYLDYVRITPTQMPEPVQLDPIGPFCELDPPFPLPTIEHNVHGTWDVGSFFDPSGLGGMTVPLIFIPNPDEYCAIGDTLWVEVMPYHLVVPDPIGPFCLNDPSVPLQIEPSGVPGTWTGVGVNGNNFSPSVAGAGQHVLTYTPTISCSQATTITVEVGQLGTPDLSDATICTNSQPLDLTNLQDPLFPFGSWSGPGVSGNIFDPSNHFGSNILTFTPSTGCAASATNNILVNSPTDLNLASTTICAEETAYYLHQLDDPMHTNGEWSGLGVNFNYFDPAGFNGPITLTFTPSDDCLNIGTTTINVIPTVPVVLGTASLCSSEPPFDLSQLVDPMYANGTWIGPGVNGNSFDPSGQSGSVTLNFQSSATCTYPATTTITVNPSATPQLETASICEGSSPLNLSALTDPAFPNGTWSGPGVSSNSFDPSGQNGIVSLSFSPSANCTETATTTVTVNQPPSINSVAEDCDPATQAYAVSFEITGGTAPYTVNGNVITANSFTSGNNPSGNSYSYEVNDAAGCGPVLVSGLVSCGCIATSSQINETLCVGESLIVNGTVYNEANPSGSETFVGMNAQGCDSTVFINLNFTDEVAVVLSQTLCLGESITVGGIVFNEANPDGSVTFTNGSYLGCDSTVNVLLGFWPAATGMLTQTLCTGGSLIVNGTVYNEAHPSGTETIQAGSGNGCDSTVFVILSFTDQVQENLNLTLCPGGSLTVNGSVFNEANPTGSVTFPNGSYLGCDSIVNIALTFLQAADSTFILTSSCDPSEVGVAVQHLIGQVGCDSTVVTTITLAETDTTLLFDTSCDPSSVGVFYENLSNSLGCDSTVVTTISYSLVDTTLLTESTCDPTEAGVFLENFVTWQGCDSMTITTVSLLEADTSFQSLTTCDPTAAGVFTNIYSNQNGCDSFVILTVAYVETDTSFLAGTTCDPTAAGVFVQNLTTASGCDSVVITSVVLLPSNVGAISSFTCDPLAAGVFVHHYLNQFGCDSLITETITLLPTDTTHIIMETCDPAQVGTFLQVLQNQFGCDSLVQTVTNLLPISACSVEFSLASVPLHCDGSGGSISFSVTVGQGPFDYEIWQAGVLVTSGSIADIGQVVTIDSLPIGDYQVVINSANGTSTNMEAHIGQDAAPSLNVMAASNNNGQEISCQGGADGSAEAQANGGVLPLSFLWSNGATDEQVSGLTAGTYSVTVTDSNGCSAIGQVSLDEPSPLQIGVSVNDPDCFVVGGGLIIVEPIGGTPPYQYALNGGTFNADSNYSGLSSGLYHIDVLDANGCGASSIVVINAPVPINVDLGDDLSIELGEGASLNALVNVPFEQLASVTWSSIGSLECPDCLQQQVFPLVTTSYSIKVIGENGCEDEDNLTVFVDRRRHVYVPNAFSPNQDGINDVFTIYIKPGTVNKVRSFLVFSRWGETVHRYENFEPNDPASGWDGTHRGEPLNEAVFTWFATIEFRDGTVELFKGDVTLMR